MFILRTGLLLATLLLSACSMPILESFNLDKTEEPAIKNTQTAEITDVSEQTISEEVVAEKAISESDKLNKERLEQLETQKKLAEANYAELKKRVGKTDELPATNIESANIDSLVQRLRSYTSKTNTDIALLNARVNERQKLATKGNLIRIFLSEATITHQDSLFKAQPLVGQWVRGETRVIRLKENILFENPKSEDLQVTFAENYQLIVNDKVVGTINPNKEKNDASFTVSTQDSLGSIVGKLDYRVVNSE
ncbi:hypothetical protein MUS1_10985 [Marinomonas ushuaiensis DSM 15871]|uniref:Lipoprotein n=1 Tax=Marinomonas ushuaiensis DSM 15871 TaxID=1122207 RepID=X7E5U6_9GAMM|nr:hypothetical protein [Marinomonas ushuaiensis]ETX11404.1 hypothetical protein MUS1_10985 [Marinomonas ushuaiensis DSM 15871]